VASTDSGSCEPVVCPSQVGARAPLSRSILEPIPAANAVTVLAMWNEDIKRAARYAAVRLGGGEYDADDLAQAARIRLWGAALRLNPLPAPYARRIISNAIRRAARREGRALGALSPRVEPLDEGIPELRAPQGDRPGDTIGPWVGSLPHRLRQLFDLLYVQACTQREAAQVLGVSQPRVAQLHRALLRRGRQDIAGFVE
jgi:RNA polymerase sigma factor (sigma-70 family)